MADTRGTWSLSEAWAEKTAAEWVPIPKVYVKGPAIDNGYVVGGNTPNTSKIDHSAGDTTSTLPGSQFPDGGNYKYSRGMSSNTAGYGAGGYIWDYSNVYKLTYATGAVSTTGNMARPIFAGGQYSNNNHGYVIGGRIWYPGPYNPATDKTSAASKVTFATDTVADSPTAFTAVACRYSVGRGDQSTVYWKQGMASSYSSTYFKTVYSTDTTSNIPATSNPAMLKINYGGASDCESKSYYFGGPAYPQSYSLCERFTWSTNSTDMVPSANLPQYKQQGPGADGSTHGYTFAGYYDPGYTKLSIMQKLNYTSETWTIPTTNFSYSCFGHFAFNPNDAKNPKSYGPKERWFDSASLSPNTAYGTAGNHGSSPVYKFDFAATTLSLPHGSISAYLGPATQSPQRYRQGAFSSSTAGYMSGGTTYIPGATAVPNQDKLTYANDTTARLPGSNLGANLYAHSGIAEETAGYYWGGNRGNTSGNNTTIFKITFATDAASTTPSQMTAGNYASSSTNSALAGYQAGGMSYSTNVQKMTFSTGMVVMLPAAIPAWASQHWTSATGTQTAGYWAGSPSVTSIAKMTWATDTGELLPSGELTASRANMFAVGNVTSGYFCGGEPGSNKRIDSLNYATETVAEVPSWAPSPLSSNSVNQWGVGARNAGIPVVSPPAETPTPSKAPGPSFDGALWMGGYNAEPAGGVLSSGGKISFSSDTVTMLPTTHLTGNRYNLAATASSEAGYYGKCQTTEVVKVTYGTGTPSVLPGGISGGGSGPAAPYDPARRGASFGPKTAGYMMQGSTGSSGFLNNFDKIVYSTEVISRLPGSNCPDATYASSGTSNQTTGYLMGGAANNYMRKLPFATETWTNASGANFSSGMWDAKTFSNSTHGFWIGGAGNATGSILYKLIYSNDTASRLPGSNFPYPTRYGWGSGNSTHGWASGGGSNTPSTTSNFYKMAYSNDTWSTASATTPQKSYQNAAAGARQNGIGNAQVAGVNPVII